MNLSILLWSLKEISKPSTLLFVNYFDKFFDALNVSKLSEGHFKRKEARVSNALNVFKLFGGYFKRKEARVPFTRPDDLSD